MHGLAQQCSRFAVPVYVCTYVVIRHPRAHRTYMNNMYCIIMIFNLLCMLKYHVLECDW